MTEQQTSKATKREMLFKKKKNLFKKYETTDFKEPIMILMRNTNKADFYENVTQGVFAFDHSSGEQRRIWLSREFLYNFPYGNKSFKGYICHEDFPIPLPNKATQKAEAFEKAIENALAHTAELTAKEWKAKGDFIKNALIGIGVLVGLYILYKLVIPDNSGNAETAVINTIKPTINATTTILK